MNNLLFGYETQIKRKHCRIDFKFIQLEIMKEYGWSWRELCDTPMEVIELAIGKLNIDRKIQNNSIKNG